MLASASIPNPARQRLSVPRAGSSLVASTEVRAVRVRSAVGLILGSIKDDSTIQEYWSRVLASRWRREPLSLTENQALQAAWALVSMRIIGRLVGDLPSTATLRDAELWFLGSVASEGLLSDNLVDIASHRAVKELESIAYDDDLRDLLPYVLDAIGPGSRASVIKDPNTVAAREAKKTAGVFYTPADVAEYITHEAIAQHPGAPTLTVLDPACGSGVFLRSALAEMHELLGGDRLAIAESHVFGIDINPLAVEAACFVLLHDCLHFGESESSPWNAWHRLRCNLFVLDALTVVRSDDADESISRTDELASVRTGIRSGYAPPATTPIRSGSASNFFGTTIELGSFAPTIASGPDVVIGNPPYASIGDRDDLAALELRLKTLSGGRRLSSADLYPIFMEIGWHLAKPHSHSTGMVVPLSIAYSSRAQIVACRKAMMELGGRWRFAFFDREPHALFGEEVKTRNAIVFHHQDTRGQAPVIETGPLRKWTSRQRPTLFETIRFTRVDLAALTAEIPKLDGSLAAEAYDQIVRHTRHLRALCQHTGPVSPKDAALDHEPNRVFVAGTAYNFLNVFRPHRQLPTPRAPWSSSALTALTFADEEYAALAFALLSSRFTYWLWHVKEDGFHVTRSFVGSLPISSEMLSSPLPSLGEQLWEELQEHQIVSVNGGRQTVAYRPHGSGRTRDKIDTLILEALGIDPEFGSYLRAFTRSVVTVDEDDESRRQFTDHFAPTDDTP